MSLLFFFFTASSSTFPVSFFFSFFHLLPCFFFFFHPRCFLALCLGSSVFLGKRGGAKEREKEKET